MRCLSMSLSVGAPLNLKNIRRLQLQGFCNSEIVPAHKANKKHNKEREFSELREIYKQQILPFTAPHGLSSFKFRESFAGKPAKVVEKARAKYSKISK